MLSGHVGLLRELMSGCYFVVLNADMADALVAGTVSVSKSYERLPEYHFTHPRLDKVFIMLSGHVGSLRESVSECYFMIVNVDMADALISETASVSKS